MPTKITLNVESKMGKDTVTLTLADSEGYGDNPRFAAQQATEVMARLEKRLTDALHGYFGTKPLDGDPS